MKILQLTEVYVQSFCYDLYNTVYYIIVLNRYYIRFRPFR